MRRFSDHPRIKVLSPAKIEQLTGQSIDVIVANSLVQYLTPVALDARLATWRPLLAPDGFLILADVIPPNIGVARGRRIDTSLRVQKRFSLASTSWSIESRCLAISQSTARNRVAAV
jgi:hypothetical protein